MTTRHPGRRRRITVFGIVWAVCAIAAGTVPATTSAASGPTSAAPSALASALAARAAAEHGVPLGRLKQAEVVSEDLPASGRHLDAAKFIDRATGEVYATAADGNGRIVRYETMLAQEQAARLRKDGRIDRTLTARLSKASPNTKHSVSVWVRDSNPIETARSRAGTTSAAIAVASVSDDLDAVRVHNDAVRQPVVDAVSGMRATPTEPEYAPVVFASLTEGQISQLAKRGDVDMIYGQQQYTSFEDDAATSHRAFTTHNAGITGKGASVRPVVHEDDGVADGNPYLNNIYHPVVHFCSVVNPICSIGKNVGNHASEVAGVIAANAGPTSTALRHRGLAPDATLVLSANSQDFSDANLVRAFEWARGNGGDPTNMSWGTICFDGQTFPGRYVDWAARYLFATIVVSAGNRVGGCSEPTDSRVSAPGSSWSVLTVGAHSDGNTGFWNDDAMASFSRFQTNGWAGAPSFKPEVSAVGVDVTTTDAQGGDHITAAGVNGTSFSAPQVTGMVALGLQRQPGQNEWPESNRAAVVASAWQDVEVGTTDRDGAGSPNVAALDKVYSSLGGALINDCNASCLPLQAADFPRTYNNAITGRAGKIRVSTAWDSWSTGGGGTDVLGADLDLSVYRMSDNALMCGSATVTNATEFCEFTAVNTQSYKIVVSRFSSVAGWPGTFVGTAWSVRTVPNPCGGAGVVSATLGTKTFAVNTVHGSSYFDDYPGNPLGAQNGKERIYTLTLGTTRDVTVSDTNGSLDLHVIQQATCAAEPWAPTSKLHTISGPATLDNLAPGTYYIVVDGNSGAVGQTTLNVTISGP